MYTEKYTHQEYKLSIDGNSIHKKAFMISVANSGQLGNNAVIAPNASMNDGFMDITVNPFPLHSTTNQ